jgi:ribosomal protein S18 acetylase RimI-like enzyme
VNPTLADAYAAAFAARCELMRTPAEQVLDEPGLLGLTTPTGRPGTRILVVDDRARSRLAGLLPHVRGGTITVFAAARRCVELLDRDPAWAPSSATAMVCRDLRSVPDLPLPEALTVVPVRRLPGDAPAGVALLDAAALAIRAAADPGESADQLADYLRSLPPAFRFFAAVDRTGAVRATAGGGVFGPEATVLFVNTDREWRHRGIGRAMTAAALRGALDAGAGRACLDASDAGVGLYEGLGFEPATQVARFHTPG